MKLHAAFQCIDGCAGEISLDAPVYRCPSCGGLLEVVHDVAELKKHSGEQWRQLLATRRGSVEFPDTSGVWAVREWVAPHLKHDNIVSLGEGGSHLQFSARLAESMGLEQLWIKQCGHTHSGSFKDLGMTVLVSVVKQMVANGVHIPAIACASTGDTSAALAAYAAAAGLPAVVILPMGKISNAQLVQPLANGATVLALDTDFDGCMAIVAQLAENDGVYLANSMNSLRLEGQKTVAIEIASQLAWNPPDWVVIPGGNLGNVSALGAGFDLMIELGVLTKRPRICVAQAQRANPLYQAYQRGFDQLQPVQAASTLASAIQIGNPVSYPKAVRALQRANGVVEQASETELAEAAALADRAGMFTCPHTGVALAALTKLIRRGEVAKSDRVVVVSTAAGLKFVDFKTRYHRGVLPDVPEPQAANRPIEVSSRYQDVREVVLATQNRQ